MSQDSQYLIDMLQTVERVFDYTAGQSLYSFYENIQLQDKVISKLINLRKVAGRVSSSAREVMSDIRWKELDTLKHRLMKDEKTVDIDMLWHVIQNELPVLAERLSTQLLCPIA